MEECRAISKTDSVLCVLVCCLWGIVANPRWNCGGDFHTPSQSFTIFTISEYTKRKRIHRKKIICFCLIPRQNSIPLSLCLYLSFDCTLFTPFRAFLSFAQSLQKTQNTCLLFLRGIRWFIAKDWHLKKVCLFLPSVSTDTRCKAFKENQKEILEKRFNSRDTVLHNSHNNTVILTHAGLFCWFVYPEVCLGLCLLTEILWPRYGKKLNVKLSLRWLQKNWGTWVTCQPNGSSNPGLPPGVCFLATDTSLLAERSTAILSCFGLCWDPSSRLLWHHSQLFNPVTVSPLCPKPWNWHLRLIKAATHWMHGHVRHGSPHCLPRAKRNLSYCQN